MMNIYARTFRIATLTDRPAGPEPVAEARRRKGPGWTARALRWLAHARAD